MGPDLSPSQSPTFSERHPFAEIPEIVIEERMAEPLAALSLSILVGEAIVFLPALALARSAIPHLLIVNGFAAVGVMRKFLFRRVRLEMTAEGVSLRRGCFRRIHSKWTALKSYSIGPGIGSKSSVLKLFGNGDVPMLECSLSEQLKKEHSEAWKRFVLVLDQRAIRRHQDNLDPEEVRLLSSRLNELEVAAETGAKPLVVLPCPATLVLVYSIGILFAGLIVVPSALSKDWVPTAIMGPVVTWLTYLILRLKRTEVTRDELCQVDLLGLRTRMPWTTISKIECSKNEVLLHFKAGMNSKAAQQKIYFGIQEKPIPHEAKLFFRLIAERFGLEFTDLDYVEPKAGSCS